ncbi:hypothetical protein BT96DRAFT_60601 [Gymnopus androsaceus JB14]|uniref:Uncharacterized protein n=1 Tax=Gymnopus androsaceus JB14 TaxID=1447944 RepID=A0A6A4HI60_9AGAR|nr:hypothetical protein BT96DRAFT_60601 [Gymnopus androsaceus JB14]
MVTRPLPNPLPETLRPRDRTRPRPRLHLHHLNSSKSRARHGCPISSLIILVYDPQYGVAPSSPRDRSTPDPNPNHHHHHHHHHNGAGANANGNGNANPNASSSSISSRDILNEEYNLRSREDEELLRRYVKGEVKFEYKKPLSQDLVPKGWPTDAYRRTCLPYSF